MTLAQSILQLRTALRLSSAPRLYKVGKTLFAIGRFIGRETGARKGYRCGWVAWRGFGAAYIVND